MSAGEVKALFERAKDDWLRGQILLLLWVSTSSREEPQWKGNLMKTKLKSRKNSK